MAVRHLKSLMRSEVVKVRVLSPSIRYKKVRINLYKNATSKNEVVFLFIDVCLDLYLDVDAVLRPALISNTSCSLNVPTANFSCRTLRM